VQWNWKVLPTDERFRSLTDEQLLLMWEHYLVDNPDLEKRASEIYQDPHYEQSEAALSTDDRAAQAREEPELEPVEIECLRPV
jgi:hypothetical protein